MPDKPGYCGNVPKPTNRPTPNGDWYCINGQWQWIEYYGAIHKIVTKYSLKRRGILPAK